jgi:hypothetical protein
MLQNSGLMVVEMVSELHQLSREFDPNTSDRRAQFVVVKVKRLLM